MRAGLLLAAILLTGCGAPPEAERVPTSAAPAPEHAAEGASQEAPGALAEGGNGDIRVRLVRHDARPDRTELVLEVRNERVDDVLVSSALLLMEGGDLYFQLDALVPSGSDRRITAEDASGDTDDRMSRWTGLTLHYTRGYGTSEADDEAAALDLRGRNLP